MLEPRFVITIDAVSHAAAYIVVIALVALRWVMPLGLVGAVLWFGLHWKQPRSRAAFFIALAALGLVVFRMLPGTGAAATPELRIEAPAGFAHETVILIEDASSNNEVKWDEPSGDHPGMIGHIAVPKSGIVRVRTLGVLYGTDCTATLTDGRRSWDFSDWRLGALRTATFGFVQGQGREPELDLLKPEALAAYVREREQEQ